MDKQISIYKFGGASVQSADAVRNIAKIIAGADIRPDVIIVSAMGKMTNAFEKLTQAYLEGSDQVMDLFAQIKKFHWDIATELFEGDDLVFTQLNDLFVEVEWVLEEEPQDPYDYTYDQIVSIGEFLSSTMVSAYLNRAGVENRWFDVRDVLKTDNAHREARVDWEWTQKLMTQHVLKLIQAGEVLVTQGFVGCTSENFYSTLGREGSDYTAAIFAYCLDADSVTIWKDVPGVLSADPKQFEQVSGIDRMTYREAIEMTYYGAKVIHPKTIKPLQNKSIPLYVRSFAIPEARGTQIGTDIEAVLPPVIVLDENQSLIHISTRDFSFVAEHHLSELFGYFARHRLKVNLMRNTAISFSVCCTSDKRKIAALIEDLSDNFKVVVDNDLQLLTVRHADGHAIQPLLKGKTVVMEERFKDTIQCVLRETAVPLPKKT